jgi:hypothetical protein
MEESESRDGRDAAGRRSVYERPSDQPCSVAVVSAVADELERDPLALPELLHTAIDVDALDAMFAQGETPTASDPTFSFDYCGYRVEVRPGAVVLEAESETT